MFVSKPLVCSKGNQKFEILAILSVVGTSSSTMQTRWLLLGLKNYCKKHLSVEPCHVQSSTLQREAVVCERYIANPGSTDQNPGSGQVVVRCSLCPACNSYGSVYGCMQARVVFAMLCCDVIHVVFARLWFLSGAGCFRQSFQYCSRAATSPTCRAAFDKVGLQIHPGRYTG